jgi:ElaB/YqjD/DUF883 family membrane-anchored ribosome-binding protein
MDPRTESIKQEVDQTLEDMAEKMEQIESRVYGAARETVQNVKEKLDVRHLTAEHPWTMLGASVAVGFLAGNIRRSESRRKRRLGAAAELEGGRRFSYEHSDDPYQGSEDEDYGMAEMVHVSGYERGAAGIGEDSPGYRQGVSGYGGREERHPSRELVRRSISRVSSRVKASAPGFLSSLKEHFGDEIEAIKKAALITVGNGLSGLIHKNLPQFAQEFDRVRQDGGQDGSAQGGWQQSQQRTQGGSQGHGESRYGGESRQGGGSQYGSGSQYGTEGRYGSGNQYGGEYQGQSERYGSQGQQGQGRSGGQGQGEGRYGSQGQQGQQGQGRSGSQGQGETRYGSQGQQGQGRSGGQGQGEGRYGGQQTRGYNPDSSNIGSSVENEYGHRDNEGGQGPSGHPTGRKGHN